VGCHVYLHHGTLVYWHVKTVLESGPVTPDLTAIVILSYQSLRNDVKPIHSLFAEQVVDESIRYLHI